MVRDDSSYPFSLISWWLMLVVESLLFDLEKSFSISGLLISGVDSRPPVLGSCVSASS